MKEIFNKKKTAQETSESKAVKGESSKGAAKEKTSSKKVKEANAASKNNSAENKAEEVSGVAVDKDGKISFKDKIKSFSFKRFFNNKRTLIVLIVVFSVLLVADLAFGTFARISTSFSSMFAGFGNIGTDIDVSDIDTDISFDTDSSSDDSSSDADSFGDISTGDMPDMDSSSLPDGSSLPGGTDSSSDSSSDDGSSDMGGLPSGDVSEGGMPSGDVSFGDTDSSDSSSDDSSSDSDSTDSDASFRGSLSTDDITDLTSSGSGGFVSWFAKAYIIIAIILALLDIACIVNLIFTSKKKKKEAKEALKAQAKEEGRIYIEHGPAKKEKSAKTAWIIPVAVIIAIILIVNLISSGSSSTAAQTEASDLSGTVETGTIQTTVPGTGTLVAEDSVEMSYASEVTVTKWYVANGDSVTEGDVIAKVDRASVLEALGTVQEAIDAIDEEIAEHEDDEISDTITAVASGRVKAVYAEADTSVVDTMYEYGCLIVISVDGLMAVDIETSDVESGDTVTVTLSDGTEEEGTVESVTNGVAVITLTDEGTDIGDSVTVTDSDGTEIGTGELYIHSEVDVTGFSGTVESVSVSVEDEVDSGDTLITLTDTEYTAEYEALIEERSELTAQMAELSKLYATGYLYADTTGIISGVDEDLLVDTSSESSDDTSSDDASSEDTSSDSDEDSSSDSDADSDDADDSDDEASADSSSLSASSEVISVETVGISALTASGAVLADGETADTDTSSEDGSSSDDDASSDEDDSSEDDSSSDTGSGSTASGSSSSDTSSDGSSMSGSSMFGSSTVSTSDTSSDSLADSSESSSSGADTSSGAVISSGSSDMDSATTGVSGTDTVSTETTEEESAYSVSQTTLCTITPQDYMTVTITVDELDILSIEVGQSAQVTLDAVAGQSFEGEVISVSLSPSNSGGNSKYTAVIQIERTDSMLAGMNASVSVIIDETEDVLIVPVAALFEEDGATYIYTSFNESNGTYSGAVEVTTGVSDGEYVEITEGLEEGDAYYYSYLDTVNYSSTIVSGGSGSISFDFGSMMQ